MLSTASRMYAEFERRTPTSQSLAEEARGIFPSGITHDARYAEPYPIYVDRAEASRKWDVDGNEYVDYFGGHGALLLGHNHPSVVTAVRDQMTRGTHYGSCHRLEIEWGTCVQRLVPSIERIRFTNSGTEATLLALRLARAFTGRAKVLRFATHFHGWHDHVTFGVGSHHDGTPTPGVLPNLAENVVLCPPGDAGAVREALRNDSDIAAVIFEPTGATFGQIGHDSEFPQQLREVTEQAGVLLIFDEVVTGFRCAPGGAQAHYGIRPDLTTLAKVLAGGLPGGAIGGRREILELLDHQSSVAVDREKVTHHGTYNANPLSAAAGIAALSVVGETDVCERAATYAAQLREELQGVIQDECLDWCVYGRFSVFHIFTNPKHEAVTSDDLNDGRVDFRTVKASAGSVLSKKIRIGMLVHGVDLLAWPGGPTSAVHTPDDLHRTVHAFQETVRALKADGDL